MIETVFWIALGGILYVYFGYPLLLLARSFMRRPIRDGDVVPSVSMVIVAHNEAAVIGEKLENALRLDYPSDKLEIIVASDGSDDGTDAIVAGFVSRGVRLIVCTRQGKIPALNRAVAQATGDVLVFSDANSMYDADALRNLVRPLADERVGGVAGNQCYLKGGAGGAASTGERVYWGLDRTLKAWQSRSGNVIAATGAIYAIRRQLFAPIPLGVCDDFAISTEVIRRGYRLVFEPNAIAREPVAASDGAEFRRKSRIAARGLRTMWHARDLFNPLRHGFYAVQIASHKLLRWSVCWMLAVLLACSLVLSGEGWIYQAALAAQFAVYAMAILGMVMKDSDFARMQAFKAVSIPYYFCLANAATVGAWMQVLQGRRVDVWGAPRQSASLRLERETGA